MVPQKEAGRSRSGDYRNTWLDTVRRSALRLPANRTNYAHNTLSPVVDEAHDASGDHLLPAPAGATLRACEGLSKHSQVVMIIARATMKKNEQRTLARFIPS